MGDSKARGATKLVLEAFETVPTALLALTGTTGTLADSLGSEEIPACTAEFVLVCAALSAQATAAAVPAIQEADGIFTDQVKNDPAPFLINVRLLTIYLPSVSGKYYGGTIFDYLNSICVVLQKFRRLNFHEEIDLKLL